MNALLPRRSLAFAGLATLALGALCAQPVFAQNFPNKPLRIIVPFTAGGSSDVQGRLLADHLGKLYKQSVVVENRPGAGGHIGGKAVIDAPADGYTLMLGSIGLHATYGVYKKLPYNPSVDFKVLTILAEMPHVVVAYEKLPVTDMKSLIALGRKSPEALNFGSAGVGSSVHMIGELFKSAAEMPMTHIAYKGSSAALNDLIGGQIQLMFENPPTVLAHVRNGRLKALAVTGKTRSPALPDVPTVAEAGIPGFQATSWTTIAVNAQVPDTLANKLSEDIRSIVSSPAFTQALAAQGMTPVGNTREAASRFVASEKHRWDAIIIKANLAAE